MLVLAGVPSEFAERLRRAAGHRFDFRPATTWADALEAILHEPMEMAVVDPGLEGPPRVHEVERIRVMFPSLPLILYARLSPHLPGLLLELGRRGVREVVVADHDDHPRRLSDLLGHEAANALSRRLIEQIEDLLVDCPGQLRWAFETIVREPAAFHSVQDLADRARMDRRTCSRWFTRAGLPSPSVVLTVFRTLYAHRLLQDPGYTVEDVAAKLGYAKTRSFAMHVREVFGMTPGELRVSLSPEDALRGVRERFFPPSTGTLAAS